MKLLRFGPPGGEKPGLLDSRQTVRDLSGLVNELNPQSLANVNLLETIRNTQPEDLPPVKNPVRIGPCVGGIGKVLCIGFNSKQHTKQMAVQSPQNHQDVVVFLKPSTAVCGPNDPILYSRMIKKLDWEAELGVVIGKQGKYIEPSAAADHILGYTCVNDLSDRYWQFETEDKQYTKAKGFDGFAPIGPYLVTRDEIENPSRLDIKLWVNGALRQDFNTEDYIRGPEEIVCYLSRFFTLMPGDVIAMGSGPGNAKSWGEDKFLKPGDRVTLEIEALGRQDRQVIEEPLR